MIEATRILDSISPQGVRLFTVKLRYPKFIHGELMTHRVFSRNASSSRAVPTRKLIEEVRSDALRATFVHWGAEQKGMGAAAELSGADLDMVQNIWRLAALNAAQSSEQMASRGASKQLVNRLLEPFSHINVLVSATEWDNFFGLRLDRAAQPEMRVLAEAIWREWNESAPKLLQPGQWHLPFVADDQTWNEIRKSASAHVTDLPMLETGQRVSVARCARVSYESFETGKRSTVEEDLRLYERLVGAQPLHASPAEHQATPDEWIEIGKTPQLDHGGCYGRGERTGGYPVMGWGSAGQHGNFCGWRQFRKLLAGEACAPLPPGYSKGASHGE